ncbi:MAG TPA: hypothetical protein VJ698_02485 [Noviherbaspirillum sp.]|uniref:beta strand repeat-containing protein n=1 Tax=Noviherbaspirillum sp. TaxID=1926288 RepID=UPI002B4A4633|nr:hypothetical protein [Noviherbaspirillum sp.]HJV84316.1 hypothetical protein [Noviherbaspirillum sp.]
MLQAAGAAGTTVQPGDNLTGGAGTDTLNISVAGDAGGAYTLSAVSTNGIEKILLSNFDTNAAATTVDAALMTGVTTMGLSSSSATGDTTFANIKNLVAGEMRNGSGDLTLTYNADVVAGTADTQNLTVSAVTGGTFTANGAETIAVKTELVKSTLDAVVSDKLAKLTVTGDQDLTITNALSWAATANGTAIDGTVDASAFTGKLTVDVSGTTSTVKVTGGSGDDTIKMAGTLTKDDVIDGGAGANTLTMNAAALTDQFTNVKNIQTVAFNAASTVSVDASKLSAGVTTIQVDLNDSSDNATVDASTITKLNGQAVVIKHGTADASNAGDADGVKLTITNATDTANDSISVTANAIGTTANKLGMDVLDVGNFEAVTLANKKSTTVTANEIQTLTASSAGKLTITGDADLTIGSITGGKMTELDASGLAGKLVATFGTNDKVKATAAQKDTQFNFGSTLDNNDTVVGGASTKDEVTATVTGLTATTGKLNISGVETITLNTTGNNTLDLSSVTGATSVSVAGNTQTITGLDLATKLVDTAGSTLKVTAANATGSNDTLTVEQKLDGDQTTVVEAKGGSVENLALIVNDTAATANNAAFTLTGFEGTKVSVSQAATSATNVNVNLGTLYKTVTTVDMSGVKGTQAASAANATAAVTFNLSGNAAANVTGSAQGDTFNIASTGNVDHTIAGNGGTDTTNITVQAGFVRADHIATKNLNISVNAGDSITLNQAFNAASTNITLAGGNSLSVFTQAQGLADAVTAFDATNFGGDIAVTVANDKLDDTVTITGGVSAKDTVTSTYATAGTYKPKTVGVETLALTASDGATSSAAVTVDLSNTSGVKTVAASVGNADTMTIDKIGSQLIQVIDMQNDNGAVTLEAKLADATGAADVVSFELKGAGAGNIDDGAILKTTDIETVNIKVSSAESISLANLGMSDATKFESVVLTGDKALTISALNANVNTIDASGMSTGGSVIQTGRSGTTAATYTGSSGDDTFIMKHAGDNIAAGSGTDTLKVSFNQVLGGLQVDLSSTGDQVTTFNGAANAAVQSGFENVDLSGITGTFGADITANKAGSIITGTINSDQITLGAGQDTVVFNPASQNGNDTIMSFAAGSGKDILKVSPLATLIGSTSGGLDVKLDAASGGKGDTAAFEVIGISATDKASADWSNVVSKIGGALTIASDTTAGNAATVILIDNGTDTRIYLFNDDATANATVETTELTLVGTLSGVLVGALHATNFA